MRISIENWKTFGQLEDIGMIVPVTLRNSFWSRGPDRPRGRDSDEEGVSAWNVWSSAVGFTAFSD